MIFTSLFTYTEHVISGVDNVANGKHYVCDLKIKLIPQNALVADNSKPSSEAYDNRLFLFCLLLCTEEKLGDKIHVG